MYKKIKWFLQRGYRGWSDRDVWSIDHYICKIMPEMLRHLAKTCHGVPMEFFIKGLEEQSEREWKKFLEDLAVGFDHMKDCYYVDPQKCEDLHKKTLESFIKHFHLLWD